MPGTATGNQKVNGADSAIIHDEITNLRTTDGDLAEEYEQYANGDGTEVTPKGVVDNVGSIKTNPTLAPTFRFVPLRMGGNGGTHVATKASAALIDEVGGVPALRDMTERFYLRAFRDATLDGFIRSRTDPHGERFAAWIHQKLGGPGRLWDADRAGRSDASVPVARGRSVVVHDRTSAHVAAWHSPKRPDDEVGRHFQLDECRVWMRLHFWAMREADLPGLSPSFSDYYVRFIGHFVRVYERTAPTFARESYRWSEKQENIDRYLRNNCEMSDVLGLTLEEALQQISEKEANDMQWPYIERADQTENESW